MLHSLASLIVEESVSSGEREKPSNTSLFFYFQIDHMIHGMRALDVTPEGGKHACEQIVGQLAIKSMIPL